MSGLELQSRRLTGAFALAPWIFLLAGTPAAASGPVIGWGIGAAPPEIMATAIAAGDGHGCAIQAATGAVFCWGQGGGQATPPPSVNGTAGTATAIAAGGNHSCAIQAGTDAVVCWGITGSLPAVAVATPPPSVDGTDGTASAIAAGVQHSCAIQAGTGAVVYWGWNDYGQTMPPPSVDGTTGSASALALGRLHSLAIAVLEPGQIVLLLTGALVLAAVRAHRVLSA
jgi:Regulator of chromosome condensation (RCC1) repeat